VPANGSPAANALATKNPPSIKVRHGTMDDRKVGIGFDSAIYGS
jgi:hypothetical protein